jgi:hypothetical protein
MINIAHIIGLPNFHLISFMFRRSKGKLISGYGYDELSNNAFEFAKIRFHE